MGNWLVLAPLCLSALSFNAFAKCDDVVFKAETTDHRKEILLCHVDNKIIYTYGGINELPDATIATCIANATYSYEFDSKNGTATLRLPNKHNDLNFVLSMSGGVSKSESELLIVDNGRPSAITHIDPKTITGGLIEGFAQYGIKEITVN